MKAIFRGIEDGFAILERNVYESDEQGGIRKAARIFRQEVDGKIHSTNWGFGPDPVRGWPYDAIPVIGQEVEYRNEAPDMAGHMVAWIGPAKEVA